MRKLVIAIVMNWTTTMCQGVYYVPCMNSITTSQRHYEILALLTILTDEEAETLKWQAISPNLYKQWVLKPIFECKSDSKAMDFNVLYYIANRFISRSWVLKGDDNPLHCTCIILLHPQRICMWLFKLINYVSHIINVIVKAFQETHWGITMKMRRRLSFGLSIFLMSTP